MPTVTVVRVFPASPEGGNPAPIVLDAGGMTDAQMRDVARHYGHESGFVVPLKRADGADFRFRYFVPNHEMEMCGHATIGALWLLRDAGRISSSRVLIETLSGQVEAMVPAKGAISVSQPVGDIAQLTGAETDEVLSVLGIGETDLARPVALNARTSRVKTLIALKDGVRLHSLTPDFGGMESVCERIGSTGLYPFAPDCKTGTFHARQFPRSSGYPEDAATGIAASALAFGLLFWDMASPTETIRIRQGEAMGRASEILIGFERNGATVTRCWIRGSCTIDTAFAPVSLEAD